MSKMKLEATKRLKADRDRFNELELEKQHSGNPAADKLSKANEEIDKLRAEIKEKSFKVREADGPAKEALQKDILSMKKKANDIMKAAKPDAPPPYKLESRAKGKHK